MSRDYLEDTESGYRSVVDEHTGEWDGRRSVKGKSLPGERCLRPSTLWRFLTWLSLQHRPLQHGIDLIQRADSGSRIHRFSGAVGPDKFRSSAREKQLRTARRLTKVIDEFARLYRRPFFPNFATAASGH